LEIIVMDWAAQLLGLGPAFMNSSGVGGGCIQVFIFPQVDLNPAFLNNFLFVWQNTASDSALIAVVAARSLFQRTHPNTKLDELVIYTTTQTHSLGLKAGLVFGLAVRALEVKTEDRFSLRGEELRMALEDDENHGRKPFILSEIVHRHLIVI
jgi:aromatic-L-amino-acid decarboxylase